ncbi:MAG: DUF3467 domain-containing protein [Bacteroidales bacterium]|nr:DUF3467 domain-containing protein [Bacteroidales bacterium]
MAENNQQIDIEIRPEVAKGNYSNLAVITHSSSEFIVDFVQMMPGLPKPTVNSRVLMTPENAKKFLKALMENVQKYESQFGEIRFREQTYVPPMGNTGGMA